MKLVVFLGYKGSGKTTAIEATLRLLTRTRLKVGTIKHIHEPGFTIDTPGKDTWKHARAGASVVIAVAPSEIATIRRKKTARLTAHELAKPFAREGFDFVLVEGLYRRVGARRGVVYILCAADEGQAAELLLEHPKAECITGKVARGKAGESLKGVPYVELPRDDALFLSILKEGR